MTQSTKVLVIGLDGATFDLIKPWAAQGHLPTLNHLLTHGVHAPLRSTMPPMTAPAWTSFATGVNPGKHRLYDWIARESDSYHFTPVTALDGTAPTIYQLLSENGRRVCALNVPMTYPAVPVNGIMLSGMPAPSLETDISHPPTLLQEITEAIGDYILYPDPGQAYSDSGVDAFLQHLTHCTQLRCRAFNHLRQREEWDFAMMVFNGTDTISHAMWKYMDQKHPLHDRSRYAKYGNAIRNYYQMIDNYLATIVDTLNDNTILILMSDHGFGPFHKFIHVNNWLMQEGWMHVRPHWRSRLKQSLFQRGFAPMNVYNILMRLGLGFLKKGVVRGNGQGLLKTLFLAFADIDWSKTAAYSLGNVGQIYLNVEGREPFGCIPPGAVYEQTRRDIMDRLITLRDPETNESVVEAVYRREDLYSGDQLHHAPDILFMPRRLEYFGFGEYEFGSHRIIEPMKRGISGTHRMDGIFMAYGTTVQPNLALSSAHITDLAPTILHSLGAPIPEHIDGRILTEIFTPTFQPTPATAQPWQSDDDNSRNGHLTAAEKQTLSERLRSLGYVG